MQRVIGFAWVLGMAAAVVVFAGCQTAPSGASRENVLVIIDSGGDAKPTQKLVGITGRPTVLQVTRQAARVTTEVTSTGEEWVTGINGRMGGVASGRVWMYELNNSQPSSAPNMTNVWPGDIIRWRLP